MKLRSAAIFAAIIALAGGAGRAHAQAPDLSRLHDALHLSHDQEAGWRAYQAAITPDPRSHARHEAATAMMADLPAPRRVDLINAEMEAEAADIRRQGDAVKAFYAVLTADQRVTFDHQGRPDQPAGAPARQP